MKKSVRINKAITVQEVRLIGSEGEQRGILSTEDALRESGDLGMDLVEISPNAQPPVCRIMDYGKYQYELSKKRSLNLKSQKKTQVKEIKFRPTTDIGDYQVKLRKIENFIGAGDKVKVTVRFRGREMQHRNLGIMLLDRIKADIADYADVETHPEMEGRQAIMVLAPKNKNVK